VLDKTSLGGAFGQAAQFDLQLCNGAAPLVHVPSSVYGLNLRQPPASDGFRSNTDSPQERKVQTITGFYGGHQRFDDETLDECEIPPAIALQIVTDRTRSE
jgi:hypothetical protein